MSQSDSSLAKLLLNKRGKIQKEFIF